MKDKNLAQKKPGKKKKIGIAVAAAAAVIVILAAVRSMGGQTAEVASMISPVEVEPVQRRDLSDTISLRGTIAGESRTNVTSAAAAEITAMNVQVGDVVKEGDVLCVLDSEAIEEQIASLEKSISDADSVDSINGKQLADAVEQAKIDQQVQIEAAKRQLEEAEQAAAAAAQAYSQNPGDETFPAAMSAQRSLEAARSNYAVVLDSTNRAVENAQLQVELSKYQNGDTTAQDTLDDLREQLADCEVKAPCGGVVTAVNMSVGDINAKQTTILTIEDTSRLKLVATVEEADILRLEEGMKASVTADATGAEEISGSVTQGMTGDAAAAGGYSVEISIDSSKLLIGMEAKARVIVQDKGMMLAVPYDLIRYDEDGSAFVLTAVKNEDGSATAVRKNITVGEEVDYYTEVTGGELSEGDMLIYDYEGMIAEGDSFSPEQMYSEQSLEGTSDDGGEGETQ